MIDLYCERVGAGLLAEPINAVSNISFFLSGLAAWNLANNRKVLSPTIWLLISILFAIAIGSSLFHTFATPLTKLLDIIPIALFQIAYLWIYSRQVIKLKNLGTVLLVILLLASIVITFQFTQIFNGSITYTPGIAILLGLGSYHCQQRKQGRMLLFSATGVFLLALCFRTIDLAICPYWSIGTHFLWHLLNGLVLYLSMKALISNCSPSLQEKLDY